MIPKEDDWGTERYSDLDAQWAFEEFCGKSFDEAVAKFAEHSLFFQEALYYMPQKAFDFYAPAFAAYIVSKDAEEDSDGASTYLLLVKWVIDKTIDVNDKVMQKLLNAALEVGKKPEFYDLDFVIYDDFPSNLEQIREYAKNRQTS